MSTPCSIPHSLDRTGRSKRSSIPSQHLRATVAQMAIFCIADFCRGRKRAGEHASHFRYFEVETGRGVSARERMARRMSRHTPNTPSGRRGSLWGHRMPIDAAVNVVGKLGFGSAAVNVFGCGEGLRCYRSELCGWLSLTGLEYLPV